MWSLVAPAAPFGHQILWDALLRSLDLHSMQRSRMKAAELAAYGGSGCQLCHPRQLPSPVVVWPCLKWGNHPQMANPFGYPKTAYFIAGFQSASMGLEWNISQFTVRWSNILSDFVALKPRSWGNSFGSTFIQAFFRMGDAPKLSCGDK